MNTHRFTFLCTKEDRIELAKLATYHHRSQSDTIRMLIRMAIHAMQKDSEKKIKVDQASTRKEATHE